MNSLYLTLPLAVLAGCGGTEAEAATSAGDTLDLVYPGQEDAQAQEAAAQEAADAVTEENADGVLDSLEALIAGEEEE